MRGPRLSTSIRCGVQQLVELVIPGDHGAGQAGDEQEGGDRQADETMREDEGLPHPVHQR